MSVRASHWTAIIAQTRVKYLKVLESKRPFSGFAPIPAQRQRNDETGLKKAGSGSDSG
jgi:hypothetical protein